MREAYLYAFATYARDAWGSDWLRPVARQSVDAAAGGAFDPILHDAVGAVPAADDVANGTIIGVARAGYMIGDEVLRPAGVVVAKGTA